MDCPWNLDLPDENHDEEHDSDEESMKEEEKKIEKPADAADFEIKRKPPLKSTFVEKNEIAAEQAAQEEALKAVTIDDDQPDLEPFDELEAQKKRLHCWILLKKGERQLTESFFIEPTTG